MRTRAALLGLVLCLAALAACGGDEPREAATNGPAETETAGETATAPAPTAAATTEETETGATGERAYEVWLAENGFLRLAWRRGPASEAVARAALDLLLVERGATALPAGADLRAVHVAGEGAHVDVTGPIGRNRARLAVAQIVYTVTQFPNVRSVLVTVDGEPVPRLEEPQTRDGLAELLAPVVVETPTGLEPVSSPIRVAGTANTFEANVLLRVVDGAGNELVSTFATATCGNGCRGDFDASLDVDVSAETQATLVVGEEDASGGEGRPAYEVEIPLLLRP